MPAARHARAGIGNALRFLRAPMKTRIKSTVIDILHQRCPRCRSGKIFRRSIYLGFPKMHERCPVCRLRFEREEGYFLGAMYISYGLALPIIALIAALLWAVRGWWSQRMPLGPWCCFCRWLQRSLFFPAFCGSIWIRPSILTAAEARAQANGN